jgi:hypothetical protein
VPEAQSAAPPAAEQPVNPPSPAEPNAPGASPNGGAATSVTSPGWTWAQPFRDPALDQGKSKAAEGPLLPWRGTAFNWSNSVTTSKLDAGSDYLSQAHQVYVQSYALLLNYYLYKDDDWMLRTTALPGFDVELTNSNTTTTRREPWFTDLPVSLVAARTLAKNEERGSATLLTGNLTLLLPTSKPSRASGTYLTASPRIGVTQTLPLFGSSAPLLQKVLLIGSFRWDHLFSEAKTPVDDDLRWPRQDLSGNAVQSDLLGGDRYAANTLRAQAGVGFSQELFGQPLDLLFTAYYQSARLYGVGSQTISLPSGPYVVDPYPGARTAQPMAGVGALVSYIPTPEIAVLLGYLNNADLGSESHNPLYTPNALFVGTLSFSIDALYLRMQGQPATEPTFIAKARQRATF